MTQSGIKRLVPQPEMELDDQFWASCARRVLSVQNCSACGKWRHIPRYRCADCGSADWEWRPVSGKGRLYTWTVTHKALHPSFADVVPYPIVVVELDEGARIVSVLEGAKPSALQIGLRVEVFFKDVDGAEGAPPLPYFRPAQSSD